MKTVPSQMFTESDYANMEAQLRALFYDLIFKPVVDLLSPHNKQVKLALQNAGNDSLVAALKSGRIQYVDGVFSGDFNAAIGRGLIKIGAKFNKRDKTYRLAPNLMPSDVLSMATQYQTAAKNLHAELIKRLDEISAGLSKAIDKKPVDANITINKITKGYDDVATEALGKRELSTDSRAKLSKEYTDNMKVWVKDFSEQMISDMREATEDNAAAGYRFDHLVKKFEGRYDVTRNKAKFLARQETAMFVSKHRQVRFEEAGVQRYVWRTARDGKVRDTHKELNGKEFFYKNPPIVDTATGRRANPGQDFNCRCTDVPILEREVANALS